ncbi:hypothetical protein P170DRAFT_435309 [Aspergillus steynii IBT 23096]|uniref:Uncharacterized protein n=1 Tax=Aspergillus steynii IBT 23096 TaxID=1392250 RepID=A0A2I2GB62_9EURO|nr:uncharacterized protein P170DRAFT_435309 [Aspergillus steynii IBT 23096]PLB50116.1 hypothetical protein P170DRAFT_435309 [Aspergillus steynii IBT 23096]
MGDPAIYTDWVQLNLLLKERYPGTSQHEACLKLFEEADSKCPEVVKRIVAQAGPIADATGGILWVSGKCLGRPEMVQLGELILGGRTAWKAISNVPNILKPTAAGPSHATPLNTTAAVAGASPPNADTSMPADSTKSAVQPCNGVDVIRNSLVDHINYYGRW